MIVCHIHYGKVYSWERIGGGFVMDTNLDELILLIFVVAQLFKLAAVFVRNIMKGVKKSGIHLHYGHDGMML